MKRPNPFHKTIRWQFIFAAAVPLLLIATLLTAYLVSARQQDSRQQFLEASQTTTAYLGDGALTELVAENRTRLSEIANNAQQFPGLSGIAYLNSVHSLIVYTTDFKIPERLLHELPPVQQLATDDRLYVQKPIYYTTIDVDDYSDDSTESRQQLVGWVIAGFDTTANRRQQRAIVRAGVSIGLGGLVVAILLSLYLGRTIVRPVHALTDTVQKMESGDLTARAHAATTEELSTLAQGINRLAESVAEGQRNLEHKVHFSNIVTFQ